jgi:hypothetical protein
MYIGLGKVVILYKMLLISFILLYSLIIGLWPVSFLCGFLLGCKYSTFNFDIKYRPGKNNGT